MCYKSINFLSQAICNTYPEMLHAAVFRRESVAEVEVAEQVLYVVPHFMGYDVSVGEITVGSYLSFHVFSVMITDVIAHSSSIKFHVSINYLPQFGLSSHAFTMKILVITAPNEIDTVTVSICRLSISMPSCQCGISVFALAVSFL